MSIPDTYTRMRVFIKNPTLNRLIDAIYALPDNMKPEYWFEYEPRPKSKRVYLTSREDFRSAMQSYGGYGAAGGFMHAKKYRIYFDGFVPEGFLGREGFGYSYGFDLLHDEEKNVEESLALTLGIFDHFSQYFDTYHSLATPIRALDAIQTARKEVFEKSLPFEDFRPDFHTSQPQDYAHAKFNFPMLGWITYLSDEIIADYALDLDELRALAWKFEEVGKTASAGQLYRIQFWEHRDDWREKTPALIDISLRADQHNYREYEYGEEIVFKRRYRVENWHEWLLPDRWWEKA